MRLPGMVMAALLFQGPLVVTLDAPARPEHLRYQRSVRVISGSSGMTCAVLDATILGHTASPAHNDLRLFQHVGGEPNASVSSNSSESEVAYTLTESGPEPVADTAATPEHVVVSGNTLSFDLRMPERPYSEVRLRLAMQNFVATATVEGRDPRNAREARKSLGSVAVYDLSSQQLGHWSSLLLEESSWPVLHVVLEVRTPGGAPQMDLHPSMVEGAEVPPSRLRQTRYVPTVSTAVVDQRGFLSIAMLRVPAHVPVERVAFQLPKDFTTNYAREVTVSARADRAPITDTEALDAGAIKHVSLPSGDPRLYPINVREEALDATMGATLGRPATVLVAMNNHGKAPLPIVSVTLEMRERKLCFFADRQEQYTLRYGDEALTAPVYDESVLKVPVAVLEAQFGPETENAHYRPRRESRSLLKRHPEMYWLALLFCAGMMGGSALHHVQHRRV